MNDLFDLPPHRELPDATRNDARDKIVHGIRGERRSGRALLPISIAAAAVVLVGGAAGLVALQHTGGRTPTAPATASPAGHQVPPMVFGSGSGGTRVERPPADQLARCAAENSRKPAGRPDPAQWQPLFSTGDTGITVLAFRTSAGPLFCELTPAMVTLSSPTGAAAGSTPQPTFVTAFGTVAGVYRPLDPKRLSVFVKTTDKTSALGPQGWDQDGVFVVANAVRVPAQSLTITTASSIVQTSPDSLGPTGRQVVVPDTGRLAVAPTRDRPLTPADQTSPAGRRLAECLANKGGGLALEVGAVSAGEGGPAVDRAAWVPGASATTADHGTVQVATYDDLYAVCISNTQQRPDVTLHILDSSGTPLYTPANPYISVAEVANETTSKTGVGYDVSPLLALPGVVKVANVATVTLSEAGKRTITATVHNRTFVFTGEDLATYYRPNADPKGTLTLLSASGAVVAKVALH
jgi:hypothetical protein